MNAWPLVLIKCKAMISKDTNYRSDSEVGRDRWWEVESRGVWGGQGTFLSFFFYFFFTTFFFLQICLRFFLWISCRNEVPFTPKAEIFLFLRKMEDKILWSGREDLGRKSCAVLEEGLGTFLSFFCTLFFTTCFFMNIF